jgi:hypothetical protein
MKNFKVGDKVRMTEEGRQRLRVRTRSRDSSVWFDSDTGVVTSTPRNQSIVIIRREVNRKQKTKTGHRI